MNPKTISKVDANFMEAARMADRYADERGSKQYKAASAVIQSRLNGGSAKICPRCSGAGGHKYWPGFTCYQCNGKGTI